MTAITPAAALDLPPNLREAMQHPVDCICGACIRLMDIGSEHRHDCKCEVCLRWWSVMGPEPED